MKIRVVILLIITMLLSGCDKAKKEINENINVNVKSAKELVEVSIPYVEDYFKEEEFHLGRIYMKLNEELHGRVSLYFADESSNSNPNVLLIEIDTENKKILYRERKGNDSKMDPGIINFDDWEIDSFECINIAKEVFADKELDIDIIMVNTVNAGIYNEAWIVKQWNFSNDQAYECVIDPYTGEVLKYGVYNNN